MKYDKLQTTLAELHKIKNQIRVELNQIRPSREQNYQVRPERTPKKIFHQKLVPTDIFGHSNHEAIQKSRSKRFIDHRNFVNSDHNKATERRHFDLNFSDKVQLNLSARKKHSPFTRVRTETSKDSLQNRNLINTSLHGIGVKDKSIDQVSKSGKKIAPAYHVYKDYLI